MAKRPTAKYRPQDAKKPKVGKSPSDGIQGLPVAWRLREADKGGPFSWANLAEPARYKEVLEKLSELEGKNWNQIKEGGSHPIPVEKLEKEARDRLVELKKDDLDELMSLRLAGDDRVWAIQQAEHKNIFRVLWWDPDHGVYKVARDKADRKKKKNRRR
jgi:hypothetical protein